MPDPGWKRLLRLFESAKVGATAVLAGSAVLGAAVAVGTSIGLGGGVGVAIGVIALGIAGFLMLEGDRERLRREAFAWQGAAVDADPFEDFFVRRWHRGGTERKLPRFVQRDAAGELRAGLDHERFVILTGERASGKSRLILETLKARRGHMVHVAESSSGPSADPLLELMRDPRGFARWEEPQVLVLRDFGRRVAAGSINRQFLRDWLDRHREISIVATLNPRERSEIAKAGEGAEDALVRLEEIARVVPLSARLSPSELAEARRKHFGLSPEQLEWLPSYLVSAAPLRDRFQGAGTASYGLGRAIVRAAADWQRAGMRRPAPQGYLRSVAADYLARGAGQGPRPSAGSGAFERGLRWALEPVQVAASLLYEVEEVGGEVGYEVDRTVIDLLDDDELEGRPGSAVPDFVWWTIQYEVGGAAKDPVPNRAVAADLIALGRAAVARDRIDVGIGLLDRASLFAVGDQEQRIAQAMAADPRPGSATLSLMSSRQGDGIARRLRGVRELAHARTVRPANPRTGEAGEPSPAIAWIYQQTAWRTALRLTALTLSDVFSAGLGLVVALGTRALLFGQGDELQAIETGWSSLYLCAAMTILVFALARLYKQDSERARLPEIVLSMSVLGAVGFVALMGERFDPLTALPTVALGILVAAFVDYRLRIRYDKRSRRWVEDHGLEARTVLIGTPAQMEAVQAARDDITRPTKFVGCIPTRGGTLPASLTRIAETASLHEAGRVLIADPDLPPRERQQLADHCHLRALVVDAVPSLADIRAGSAEFISGQSLVVVPLEPLWQSDPGFYAKRTLDVVLALLALALLSPLLLAIAVAVLASGRQVIVRSWRPGLGGDVFGMYRFRTTVENPRSPIALSDRGDDQADVAGELTTAGARLRRHGLDELPQLFNVIRGQMSLVGPRPLHLSTHAKLEDDDLLRYVVRPGATSPWQVCGRQTLRPAELTNMDMAYLRRWSLLVDLEILVKTARLVLKGRKKLPKLEMAQT